MDKVDEVIHRPRRGMQLMRLTVSRPSETVPTNLRTETPREVMVLGVEEWMGQGSMSMSTSRNCGLRVYSSRRRKIDELV